MRAAVGIILTSVLLFGCGGNPNNVPVSNALPADTATPMPTPALPNLTLEQVSSAFKKAKLPMTDEMTYDAATDRNHMLGRDGGYTEKMNWVDSRAPKGPPPKTDDERDLARNCTIEVFVNHDDAVNRKTHTDHVGRTVYGYGNYAYLYRNILVRVTNKLTQKQADEYGKVLESL